MLIKSPITLIGNGVKMFYSVGVPGSVGSVTSPFSYSSGLGSSAAILSSNCAIVLFNNVIYSSKDEYFSSTAFSSAFVE